MSDVDMDDVLSDSSGSSAENDGMKQVRAQAKALEKDLGVARRELEELRSFREQVVSERNSQTFQTLGMTEPQSNLFLQSRGDSPFTPDDVKAWAAEVGMNVGGSVPDAPAPTEQAPRFQPTVVAGGMAPGAAAKLTRDEFEAVMREDPARASELIKQNKVQWNNS